MDNKWNMTRVAALCMMFLCVALAANSAEVWVSKSGSDTTGDGSAVTPYATISHALEMASAGDEIVVRGGTYEEQVRIRIPNITIRPAFAENVHVTTSFNNPDMDATVIFDVDSDGSQIRNLEISGGYYYGIMLFTKWDWGDPEDRSGACNLMIEGCNIHDTGRDCVKITPGCDDITIAGCEIHHSGRRDDSNAEGIDCVNGDRVVVQDCWIHDTATTGIYLKGGSMDGVVERTLVERCGSLGIALGFDTSPEYFDLDANPQRYENIRGIVRNCIVSQTTYAGIAFYGALDATAVNNTILNTALEGHAPIYFGTPLQDWEVDPDPEDGIDYRTPTVNPDVRNNVVWQMTGYGSMVVEIRTFHHDSLGRVNGLEGLPTMDHNIYFVADGDHALFTDHRPDSELIDGTLAQWRTHIGGEANSMETDPRLGDRWFPEPGSPCVDNGASDVPVADDYDGEARVPPFDIGAFETNSSWDAFPVLHIPHIAHRNYVTYLRLIQPSQEQASIRVTLRDNFGLVLETVEAEAAGYQTVEIPISDAGGPSAAGGEIHILSGNPIVRIVYRNTEQGMADFLLSEDSGRRIALMLAQEGSLTWHGLAIRNVSNSAIGVTLHAYGFDGTYLGFETIDLAVRGQIAGLVGSSGDWFQSIPLSDVALVEASVSSGPADARITGLTISGAGQSRLLFTPAVPVGSQ